MGDKNELLGMPLSAIRRVIELAQIPHRNNSWDCGRVDPEAARWAINLLVDLPAGFPEPVIMPVHVPHLDVSWLAIDWEQARIMANSGKGGDYPVSGVVNGKCANGVGAVYQALMIGFEGEEAWRKRMTPPPAACAS